ncbi:MAG: COP23 domain-containing protein [Geminocystis sp.]|nr:COP23 domain-containing protein [Geminocystis sp.]HIK38055.1 hypothetical protein [Geminocystis sp. M7585_C2015_104]MCS7146913.1 COP23 domain-containing protein [Geminocystis sp.]MCX8078932.1 COP23 domain-containing protein [Geminocystis sp.]MDW8115737.1 COP23 domain-containing protein [Geminocystis sp.]
MKNYRLSTLVFSLIPLVLMASNGEATAQSPRNRYSCILHENKPTTVVDTPRGRIALIVWQSDYFRSSGWTPQKRCYEVTRRFQKFSDEGKLRYITTGTINNQPAICVGERKPGGFECLPDGLLITLERGDNPKEVLQNLFLAANPVGGRSLVRGSSVFLDIEDYLKKAPVIPTAATPIPPRPSDTSTPANPDCPSLFCPQ